MSVSHEIPGPYTKKSLQFNPSAGKLKYLQTLQASLWESKEYSPYIPITNPTKLTLGAWAAQLKHVD